MKKIFSFIKMSAVLAVTVATFVASYCVSDNFDLSGLLGISPETEMSQVQDSQTENLESIDDVEIKEEASQEASDNTLVENSTKKEPVVVKAESEKSEADTKEDKEVSEKEETTETVEKPSTSEKKEESKPSTQSTTSEKKEEVAAQPEQVAEQPVNNEAPVENPAPAQLEVHVHNWVMETIHHDAVTHQETVTNIVHHDAVIEEEYVPVQVCECGGRFYDADSFFNHECDTCQWSCIGWEKITTEVSPAWDEEVTETVTITDSPAWDEVYTYCSDCGATE